MIIQTKQGLYVNVDQARIGKAYLADIERVAEKIFLLTQKLGTTDAVKDELAHDCDQAFLAVKMDVSFLCDRLSMLDATTPAHYTINTIANCIALDGTLSAHGLAKALDMVKRSYADMSPKDVRLLDLAVQICVNDLRFAIHAAQYLNALSTEGA